MFDFLALMRTIRSLRDRATASRLIEKLAEIFKVMINECSRASRVEEWSRLLTDDLCDSCISRYCT